MAYFLKQTKLNGRTYLSIVDSFYSHQKKGTSHKVYKSLASIETWKKNGLEDPVAHFQKEVDQLNAQRQMEKTSEISDRSPKRYLGYFFARLIMDKLQIRKEVDYFKLVTDFDFDLYEVMASLIFSRLVNPCSKYKTYTEVIPYLFEEKSFSYDQLLTCVRFLGSNYEKFVEMFAHHVNRTYSLDTRTTYFDCTNFYFEIDKEDVLRRKGPSKENRKDPIVSLGLLLDRNMIPAGMKIFPGNQSEKPVLRQVVDDLKRQNNISGKTVHVADKGLNSAKNIYESISKGDGYLFSRSVKQLPETEKVWILLENDYKNVTDKDGRLLYRYKSCIDEFPYSFTDENGIVHKFTLKEKRVITYNPSLAKKKKMEIDRMADKAAALTLSAAKRSEYGESGRYVDFKGRDNEKAKPVLNQKKIDEDRKLAGYNLLVTSETKMSEQEIYATYHNLWRIEESFKIMKSDLDARPVYMKTEETIKGHFLICYLAVLIERILQFVILENRFSSEAIFCFFKNFIVVKGENRYINISTSSDLIRHMKDITGLPLTNYELSETQLKRVLNYKL